MYVKSVAVALQALCIISIGPLANDGEDTRGRVLIRQLSCVGVFLSPLLCPDA